MNRMLRTALFGLALTALPLPVVHASAQVVTLDEGSFRILVDEVERGTETFTIRRNGIGADATVILAVQIDRGDGGVSMRPMLEADAQLAPLRYENQISGERRSEVSLVRNGRRFSGTVISEQGEAAQEYRAATATLILPPRVAALYWFLTPHLAQVGREISGIEPETGGRPTMVLAEVSPGTLRVGRETFQVRIATLTADGDERRVWFDDQGRVLRVEIPAQGFVAERLPEG